MLQTKLLVCRYEVERSILLGKLRFFQQRAQENAFIIDLKKIKKTLKKAHDFIHALDKVLEWKLSNKHDIYDVLILIQNANALFWFPITNPESQVRLYDASAGDKVIYALLQFEASAARVNQEFQKNKDFYVRTAIGSAVMAFLSLTAAAAVITAACLLMLPLPTLGLSIIPYVLAASLVLVGGGLAKNSHTFFSLSRTPKAVEQLPIAVKEGQEDHQYLCAQLRSGITAN